MGGNNSGQRPSLYRRGQVVQLRAKGLTLQAIGNRLGVTRQAVHDLLKNSQRTSAWPGLLRSACGKPVGSKPRLFMHANGPVRCLVCLPADASLGQRLKSYRVTAGLTLTELAKRTGIAFQTLSEYERGLAHPEWPNVERLIKAFGVALVDIGKHFLDRPTSDLDFSMLTDSLLARAGIRTIRQLRRCSAQSLQAYGFTPMPLQEVRAKLAEYGLSLAGE
jgi:transcriptional regulator with XRE-family HTH domain